MPPGPRVPAAEAMEKIDGTSGLPFRPDYTPEKKKQEKTGKSGGFTGVLGKLFSSNQSADARLDSVHPINSDHELQEIIGDIQRLGEELVKYPGIDNLTRYKQAIRDFIAHVTDNAYSTEEHISRRTILNQKKYTIIKVIDERLDDLSRKVFVSQSSQIDMLANLEEIQGLLVNILHRS